MWLGSVAVGVLIIGAVVLWGAPTNAHEDPSECNASGLQQFPSVGPSGQVYDGSTLTYEVTYSNVDPNGTGTSPDPCNITDANARITYPDGSVMNILTNETLNVGDIINCPGDAECAAGPYTYVVDHADENGSSSVQAQFDVEGVLHQDADEEEASDHDTLSKTVIHPSTVLTKEADQNVIVAGETVTYTYTETNDGDVPLINPTVTDDTCAPVVGVDVVPADGFNDGDTNTDGVLDPGEAWVYTCSMVINENTTNTAVGHGVDPKGNEVTWTPGCAIQEPEPNVICDPDEQAQTSVRVLAPLEIEKTVDTSYDRQWRWTIDKSADQTDLLLAEGEAPVTVNYEVMVSALSEDINHLISGLITVTNPAGNPVATVEDVMDAVTTIGPATVDCTVDASFTGFPHALGAEETLTCAYWVAAPDGDSETNTATVVTSGEVPGNTVDEPVTFGDPTNEVDECIVVNDTNPQGPQGWAVCAGDVDMTYEYSISFGNHPDADVFVECGETDHPNIADFITNDTQTTGEDDWNVHITVECLEGCTLTLGYWKTHNDSFWGGAPTDDNWENIGDWDLDGTAEAEQEELIPGYTWFDVFWTPVQGRVWYQLAHQWMAAYLNMLNGASTTPEVDDALADGWTWLMSNDPTAKLKGAAAAEARNLAAILGAYNEGITGPGHCDEPVVEI